MRFVDARRVGCGGDGAVVVIVRSGIGVGRPQRDVCFRVR